LKFEHVLQIYWTKGFFYGGQLFYFNQTINSLETNTPGLSQLFKVKLKERFELSNFYKSSEQQLMDYENQTKRFIIQPLNIILSQISTVNSQLPELHRLIIIRMYLIRSYRGRCHAIGKPVKGQRTWSNAWTSYKINKVLRTFIHETSLKLRQNQVAEKINYKIVKKKYASKLKKKKNNKCKKSSVVLTHLNDFLILSYTRLFPVIF
jgi:ribosomal protein S13